MIKNHLFYCDTPFQIMMAIAFKKTIFRNDRVDIVVSNIIAKSESIYNNIKRCGLFHESFYFRDYEIDYTSDDFSVIKKFKQMIFRKKIVKSMIEINDKYQAFYAVDTLPSIEWLYEVLKDKNSDLQMCYYEEGPIAVLCDQGKHFKRKEEYNFGWKSKLIKKILNIKHINGNYDVGYTSVRKQVPSTYFEWRDIPIVKKDSLKEYVSLLNSIWGYHSSDVWKGKVIFLEESFFTDGRENRDIEILKDMLTCFEKERIIVKMHPRTRVNRYQSYGVKVYDDNSVPWELVALNGDLEQSILVCIGSGSILYPKLYWNISQVSIALLDCEEYHFSYLDNEYYRLFSDVCKKEALAYMPKTRKEFMDILRKY